MQEAAAEIKLKHLLPIETEGRTKWKYRSCRAVWLWEANFKDEHFGSCGLKVQSLLIPWKGFFLFHVHCLFARQRDSALWDTLNCDILVAEVLSELLADLSCGFYHSHPRSYKLVNEHLFSTIGDYVLEIMYCTMYWKWCISRHMCRLINQKGKDLCS